MGFQRRVVRRARNGCPCGMNAIAHPVEGLYARDRNPIASRMTLEGIRAVALALRNLTGGGSQDRDRGKARYGAWLYGPVRGPVGIVLHHKLCHAFGGGFNLAHAVANTEPAVPDMLVLVAENFGSPTAHDGLSSFVTRIAAQRSLSALGWTKLTCRAPSTWPPPTPVWNPRPVDPDAIAALLSRALAGDPHQS